MSNLIKTFLLLLATTASSQVTNVDSLLVLSVGGASAAEKIQNLQNIIATSTVNFNGQPGTSRVIVQMPDKLFVELRLGEVILSQGYDGTTGWQSDMNGSVSRLSGHEAADLMRQVYLQTYSFLVPDRLPGGKEYKGIVDVDGRPHHVILLTPLHNDTIFAYLDAESCLPTQTVSRLDNLETINRNGDFRTVSDIVMPFFSRSEIGATGLFVELKVDECLLDAEIDPAVFSMSDQQMTDFLFPDSTDRVTIPFQMEYGHIYLTANVNGRRQARFILDSGASSNMLNRTAFQDDSMAVVGQLPTRGVSGFETANLVQTDSISIGKLVLYNQTAGSIDLDQIGRVSDDNVPFGGLLGYDFLSRFPVLIKYADSTITVFNPKSFDPPAGGATMKFDLTMRVPTVDGTIEGVPGKFLVDLGNAFGLVLHPHFVKANDLETSIKMSDQMSKQFSGVGGNLGARMGVAERFLVGDLLFENTTVLVPESGTGLSGSEQLAGNIGNALLEQFDVLFDYADGRLILFTREDKVN